MFKHILVPLDGSTRAESAMPVAARIARAYGSSITLLRVVETIADHGAYLQPVIEDEKAEAKSYLESIANSTELAGIETSIEIPVGAIAPNIIAAVLTTHANLVVMCSHGYTGIKRWALGSVAEKIARHAPVPVLILREGETFSTLTPQKPVRALVALDGSPFSEAVFEPVAYLVAGLAYSLPQSGELHLLRVIDLPFTSGKLRSQAIIDTQTREQAKQEAQAYLNGLVARMEEAGLAELNIEATASVESDPDVAEAIVKQAEGSGIGYDLIAMATHGRGGADRFVMGSITERVLHATNLPLLVVRPPKSRTSPVANGKEDVTVIETTDVEVQSWVGLL
ncbi:MAG TPA: universal stress protein [Ktedonobacteraceae bacterium]|nr:universal stress protein [Ktedonobacteraceae bacterium]